MHCKPINPYLKNKNLAECTIKMIVWLTKENGKLLHYHSGTDFSQIIPKYIIGLIFTELCMLTVCTA